MLRHPLWDRLPHVRTGSDLSLGERSADLLKRAMGTWSMLGLAIAGVGVFMATAKDPGHLNLNLALSLVAAFQGIILQIALNRGDRIASELALATHKNGIKVLEELEEVKTMISQRERD